MADKITFEEWMRRVDKRILARVRLTAADLADCAYRDWYDQGLSAQRAAGRAIRNQKEG